MFSQMLSSAPPPGRMSGRRHVDVLSAFEAIRDEKSLCSGALIGTSSPSLGLEIVGVGRAGIGPHSATREAGPVQARSPLEGPLPADRTRTAPIARAQRPLLLHSSLRGQARPGQRGLGHHVAAQWRCFSAVPLRPKPPGFPSSTRGLRETAWPFLKPRCRTRWRQSRHRAMKILSPGRGGFLRRNDACLGSPPRFEALQALIIGRLMNLVPKLRSPPLRPHAFLSWPFFLHVNIDQLGECQLWGA